MNSTGNYIELNVIVPSHQNRADDHVAAASSCGHVGWWGAVGGSKVPLIVLTLSFYER